MNSLELKPMVLNDLDIFKNWVMMSLYPSGVEDKFRAAQLKVGDSC